MRSIKSIYKYPLEITDLQIVEMPKDAKVLSLQMQNGRPTIWALVDTQAHLVPQFFRVFGTGQPIENEEYVDQDLQFIGTVQADALVFHVFKVNKFTTLRF